MAWIESHAELRRHPKLIRLSMVLKIHPLMAIGHLHVMWWWATAYAKDGVLTGCSTVEISEAAEWGGDPDAFLDALIAAGFVDRSPGKLILHDWSEYRLHYDRLRAKIEDRRQQIRERVQRFRQTKRHTLECNASVTLPGNAPTSVTPALPVTRVTPKTLHTRSTRSTRSTKPTGATDEWLAALRANPAYRHINFDIEFGKMEAWFSLPKNKHRKRTQSFILKWFNKIEAPLFLTKTPAGPPEMTAAQRRMIAREEELKK